MAFDKSYTPQELYDLCFQALTAEVEELPDGTAMSIVSPGVKLHSYVDTPSELGMGRIDIEKRGIWSAQCPGCHERGTGVITVLKNQVACYACTLCNQFLWFRMRRKK